MGWKVTPTNTIYLLTYPSAIPLLILSRLVSSLLTEEDDIEAIRKILSTIPPKTTDNNNNNNNNNNSLNNTKEKLMKKMGEMFHEVKSLAAGYPLKLRPIEFDPNVSLTI